MAEKPTGRGADISEVEKRELGRYKKYPGFLGKVPKAIAAALALFSALYLTGVFELLRIPVYSGQYVATFIGGMVILTFLLLPGTKKSSRDRLAWYDVLLCLATLAPIVYFIANHRLAYLSPYLSTVQAILAGIFIVVVAEAVRRTLGWSLIILVAVFGVFALTSRYLPGLLHGPKVNPLQMLSFIYFSRDGLLGTLANLGATLIFGFMVFSAFLVKGGAGDFFINLAMSLFGRFSGGPAKVAVVSSALFGSLSGSATANVAVTGSITIPMMKRLGYKPYFAGAVEAVASTGGAIMPPVMGGAAFLVADFSGLGYPAVIVAAAIPAFLYYWALYVQVDREAKVLGLQGLPPDQIPSFWKTIKEGWFYAVPILVLLLVMFVTNLTPQEAAVYAAASIIPVSWLRKETRVGLRKIYDALADSSILTIQIASIVALIGIVTTAINITGVTVGISEKLVAFAGGNKLLLGLIMAFVCYIMGMGVSNYVSYILLATLMVPAWLMMGVPVIAAHMFILYFGLSMFITPPFAPAVFVATTIAQSPVFKTGWQAMRLAIILFVIPFIFIYQPALLMIGTPLHIAFAFGTAILGVAAMGCGLEGYLTRRIGWVKRVLLLLGGLAMVIPSWQPTLAGAVVIALVVLWELGMARKLKPVGSAT